MRVGVNWQSAESWKVLFWWMLFGLAGLIWLWISE